MYDMSNVDDDAKILLNYMRLGMKLEPCDVIVGHGCLDTRVAERAAQLFLDGYGGLLVFSGGYGRITKDFNDKSEAETFRDVAVRMGVPENKIMIETGATNTGENVVNTEKLLSDHGIQTDSIIIVTKPYMERRAYATFMKQRKKLPRRIYVTSPNLSYEDHFADGTIAKDMFLNVMVGDLQRLEEFPKRGFQIEQDIPAEVWAAYDRLVAAGYTEHLLT